jgi:hypothetical protein
MRKRRCCRRKRWRGRSRPARDALSFFAEDLKQAFLPIAEDALDVRADKEPIHQRAATRMVTDVVAAERTTIALGEGVGVVPQIVGPGKLLIDELMRRIPDDNLGSPANGDAVNLDAVIDEKAGVRTSNFSHGGVSFSRLRASLKKGKTSSRGRGSQSSVLKRNSFICLESFSNNRCAN